MSEHIMWRLKEQTPYTNVLDGELMKEAAAEITRLREENARLREENDAWQMDGGSCAEEVKRLREENARYKQSYQQYVEATDRMNGTPCEQIRHGQQVEALRKENARLREALKPFAELAQHTGSMSDSDGVCVYVEDLRAAAAAIREGGNRNE